MPLVSEFISERLFLSDTNTYLGIVTLNRPSALNALSLDMVLGIHQQLTHWATDPEIDGVVVTGASGRSFCAGGDVKALRAVVLGQDIGAAERFFDCEYRLDDFITHYPKPMMVFGFGVVMGGGVGLLQGAKYSVLHQDANMAMPEILIGLFPDVGCSYYLPRLKQGMGALLGLTGIGVSAYEAKALGWTKSVVSELQLKPLLLQLAAIAKTKNLRHPFDALDLLEAQTLLSDQPNRFQEETPVTHWCAQYWQAPPKTPKALGKSLEQLLALAQPLAGFESIAINVNQASAFSLWLAHLQLQQGKNMSLAQSFSWEKTLCIKCIKQGDFLEAVRAKLVDKTHDGVFVAQSLAQLDATLFTF